MYVSMKEILVKAQEGGYGVTAPNVFSEDTVRAVIEAAEEYESPMIIDFGMMGPPEKLVSGTRLIEDLARSAKVPICLNQDHGPTYESAIWCIRAGFTSIMADRSMLPYEDNVAQVAELVKVAHAVGVTVEAELGHVGFAGEPEGTAQLTDPEMAADFVAKTGIDCLAVAIGTAHGQYKEPPKLDFPRLEAIRKAVSVPLVLHGGSSTGDEQLARACREGICKVNLATDLIKAGEKNIVDSGFPNPPHIPGKYYSVTGTFVEGYKNMLVHYMKLFGQVGKAW
ncbi:MAG: class II fructose-bisphosphate aldolase [Lachnospiraceae bacterium]|jgi:fructose-bisphosphate aldolase class II|nr:class II fructose-bisphosphate aldolase [Lachnospiraceae bacterium]